MNSRIFTGLLILSLAAAPSFCATIFLDSGERITGEIVAENADFITFRSNNVDNQYNKKFIKRIFKDNAVIDAAPVEVAAEAPSRRAQDPAVGTIPDKDSEFNLMAGIDFPSQYTEGDDLGTASFDITSGLSIAGEYTKYMKPANIGVGYGVAYEIPRKFQDFKAQISFLPVYALIKLRTTPNPNNEFMFFTGQLGYNEFFGNNDYLIGGISGGGLYLGAGIGAEFPLMTYTLLYTSNSGTLTFNGSTLNVSYSKVSFMVGVKLD